VGIRVGAVGDLALVLDDEVILEGDPGAGLGDGDDAAGDGDLGADAGGQGAREDLPGEGEVTPDGADPGGDGGGGEAGVEAAALEERGGARGLAVEGEIEALEEVFGGFLGLPAVEGEAAHGDS
jgi:hypothetical protein